jgi:hypothetical protein
MVLGHGLKGRPAGSQQPTLDAFFPLENHLKIVARENGHVMSRRRLSAKRRFTPGFPGFLWFGREAVAVLHQYVRNRTGGARRSPAYFRIRATGCHCIAGGKDGHGIRTGDNGGILDGQAAGRRIRSSMADISS